MYGVVYLIVRDSRFGRDYQLPVGLLIVEVEFFDLHRVGCQQMQEGSLKVCFWTVWPFEKLVDFGSVLWSEVFANLGNNFCDSSQVLPASSGEFD